MKRFLILICITLLSACQSLAANRLTSTPSEVKDLPSNIQPESKGTQIPSATPFPTETSTPLPPQSFDPTVIQTVTPAIPAQCPKENPSLEFDVEKIYFGESASGNANEPLTKRVLDFLNSGGTLQSIMPAFEKFYGEPISPWFKIQDVTGDNVPELIFPYGISMYVFGCQSGEFELLSAATYESDLAGVGIIDISDINQDGLAEIVVYFNGCMGNRCPVIRVYEWNGKEFQDLIADSYQPDNCSNLSVAPFEVIVRDIDNNGTKEIILSNNDDPWPDNDFPYRKETRTCMWNGQNIVVYETDFDAPYYRFQAVQDGDRATLAGDYDKAFSFYQQTINDKQLQWFTQDRKLYDFGIYYSKVFSSFNEPTPTTSPTLVEDPTEYSLLAAYAYYRIMLLDILQNDKVDAESTFNILQSEFPAEAAGNYFTEVASVFWEEYQISMNIENSCGKVVEYATANPIPAEYLGDWEHGVHSILYTPELICPFR